MIKVVFKHNVLSEFVVINGWIIHTICDNPIITRYTAMRYLQELEDTSFIRVYCSKCKVEYELNGLFL